MVAEMGPQAMTLRELARRIGVSHAAPYRHFADKRALMTALAVEGSLALHERIAKAIEREGDDLRAQFLGAGYAYVKFAIDEPSLFSIMFSREITTDDPALVDARARPLGLLFDYIARAQAKGVIATASIDELAQAVWAMHHGLAHLALAGKFADTNATVARESIDRSHSILLDGLLAHNVRRSGAG